mmetsp:Transcript_29659/g.72127  ORF Transcript_29659/g.72127 Transcript_29659/m.72127 type:complete len:139 (+) Transcript_29659:141-557(+)
MSGHGFFCDLQDRARCILASLSNGSQFCCTTIQPVFARSEKVSIAPAGVLDLVEDRLCETIAEHPKSASGIPARTEPLRCSEPAWTGELEKPLFLSCLTRKRPVCVLEPDAGRPQHCCFHRPWRRRGVLTINCTTRPR